MHQVVAMLREALSPHAQRTGGGKQLAWLKWVNTDKMAADGLTKVLAGCPALLAAMASRKYRPRRASSAEQP